MEIKLFLCTMYITESGYCWTDRQKLTFVERKKERKKERKNARQTDRQTKSDSVHRKREEKQQWQTRPSESEEGRKARTGQMSSCEKSESGN